MNTPRIDLRNLDRIACHYFAPFEVNCSPDDPNLARSSRAWTWITKVVTADKGKGLALIAALAERAPDEDRLGTLGAGPLEDFVREHGESCLDQLDQAAARSQKFRYALTHVWGWRKVPDRVWDRMAPHLAVELGKNPSDVPRR